MEVVPDSSSRQLALYPSRFAGRLRCPCGSPLLATGSAVSFVCGAGHSWEHEQIGWLAWRWRLNDSEPFLPNQEIA